MAEPNNASEQFVPAGDPERCPACGNNDAWHGVIVEPDEAPRWACDECGHVQGSHVASEQVTPLWVPSGYRTIVADPPWPSMHQRSTYHRGKPERHYSTMPVDDICALPVTDWAADDAHLWVWGVNRLMEDAYRVVRAWGFTPMSVLTWCKPGPGMGYYLRTNTEHCIFATRGKPMVPETKAMSSWFQWPRLRHSQKPDEFFEIVETVSPAPRLEMFARSYREGWDSWGNEAPRRSDVSRLLGSDVDVASTDGGAA